MKALCRQLAQEHAALDKMVKDLSDSKWDMITPFDDWTIRQEICHIAYFDGKAGLAATDPDGFQTDMLEILDGVTSVDEFLAKTVKDLMKLSSKALMDFWSHERTKMINAIEIRKPQEKIVWYGPPMTAESFVIARMMETWAHGQDIADALKIKRLPTERLKHIAHLGVKTFGWSYKNRGLEKPGKNVCVELKSPSGEIWQWNPEQTDNLITGSAEDFCLVVAQRRHIDDTRLVASGPIAREWMSLAQVFAGPAEQGPEAGRFKPS
jgi:uncharacterized protein (TIGR03084 family)